MSTNESLFPFNWCSCSKTTPSYCLFGCIEKIGSLFPCLGLDKNDKLRAGLNLWPLKQGGFILKGYNVKLGSLWSYTSNGMTFCQICKQCSRVQWYMDMIIFFLFPALFNFKQEIIPTQALASYVNITNILSGYFFHTKVKTLVLCCSP